MLDNRCACITHASPSQKLRRNYEKIHDIDCQYLLKKLEDELRDGKDQKMEDMFVLTQLQVLANTNPPTLGG